MRVVLLIAGAMLALASLGACKREPTFEERYAGAQKAIRDKASELDKDMARRAAEARQAPLPEATAVPSQVPGAT